LWLWVCGEEASGGVDLCPTAVGHQGLAVTGGAGVWGGGGEAGAKASGEGGGEGRGGQGGEQARGRGAGRVLENKGREGE
jgi:hypothetical protein